MKNQSKITESLIGKEVIVRADKAGVFFGTLNAKEGDEVQLLNCRKLYYWSGANTVEQLAEEGVKKPQNCKFTQSVKESTILNALQIIPCTKEASQIIKNVHIWKH